jgi:hypothetical protein
MDLHYAPEEDAFISSEHVLGMPRERRAPA